MEYHLHTVLINFKPLIPSLLLKIFNLLYCVQISLVWFLGRNGQLWLEWQLLHSGCAYLRKQASALQDTHFSICYIISAFYVMPKDGIFVMDLLQLNQS